MFNYRGAALLKYLSKRYILTQSESVHGTHESVSTGEESNARHIDLSISW